MSLVGDVSRAARGTFRLLARPTRTARGERGIVLQPYRGYGSSREIFLIGRVFRQSRRPPGDDDLRDIVRRLKRRSIAGVRIRARFYATETVVETDDDGYFRVSLPLAAPPPEDRRWHPLDLRVEGPQHAEARAGIYIPPPGARYVVISDIDDTVMRTGVANKAKMLWRLFVENADERRDFPGVAALYRGLHHGVGGDEGNPMLYVSRAPWGIYDILDTFFRARDIPVGPILFLREWGVSWKRPLPRRAKDHKRILIEAMMTLYHDMPFVLIGDSGQHDPEVYRHAVERFPDRVIAVYIRDVSPHDHERAGEIRAIAGAVTAAGSRLVLATDSLAIAEHAAGLGLVGAATVAEVAGRLATAPADTHPSPTEYVEIGPRSDADA